VLAKKWNVPHLKKHRKKAQTLQPGPVNPLFSEEWRRQVVQQFRDFFRPYLH
jgi:hypothetical protein